MLRGVGWLARMGGVGVRDGTGGRKARRRKTRREEGEWLREEEEGRRWHEWTPSQLITRGIVTPQRVQKKGRGGGSARRGESIRFPRLVAEPDVVHVKIISSAEEKKGAGRRGGLEEGEEGVIDLVGYLGPFQMSALSSPLEARLDSDVWVEANDVRIVVGQDRTWPRGLSLGLLGLPRGSRRRILVPPQYAYGEQGGENVPPDTPLIFDVLRTQ